MSEIDQLRSRIAEPEAKSGAMRFKIDDLDLDRCYGASLLSRTKKSSEQTATLWLGEIAQSGCIVMSKQAPPHLLRTSKSRNSLMSLSYQPDFKSSKV
jgi:hypothetical protein